MGLKEKLFYAKILLFGEYSLMYGSAALTIPFTRYRAQLFLDPPVMDNKSHMTARASNKQLKSFYAHLHNQPPTNKIHQVMDLPHLKNDLEQGLYLSSAIPSGYGIGSSGALVAALFFHYARREYLPGDVTKPDHLAWFTSIFSEMEAFFHGQSSGIDPLSCYLQTPLLIKDEQLSTATPDKSALSGEAGFFLINTRIPRKTSALIRIFQEKMKQPWFRRWFHEEYILSNDACIEALLTGDPTLNEKTGRLSAQQFTHFQEMIPERFQRTWEEGLNTGTYFLKLCGAGGGGYLLGYTKSYQTTMHKLKAQGIGCTQLPLP